MVAMPVITTQNDDPRKLRDLLQRNANPQMVAERALLALQAGLGDS